MHTCPPAARGASGQLLQRRLPASFTMQKRLCYNPGRGIMVHEERGGVNAGAVRLRHGLEASWMPAELDVEALWQQVNEAIRRGPINRGLWEAAAVAKPLTIEGDTLVLGFEPKDMRHASYLETTVNKTRIQEILQARTGRRLDIKCIEGATLQAWENVKQREAEREARLRASVEHVQAHGTTIRAWEDLNQRLISIFSSTEARRLPGVQATLLVKSLPMVYETDSQVRTSDPGAEVIHNRELNRIFEKLGTYCDLPPTQVALEYMRYRSSRKSA